MVSQTTAAPAREREGLGGTVPLEAHGHTPQDWQSRNQGQHKTSSKTPNHPSSTILVHWHDEDQP